MITILRLAADTTSLITADVFEELFRREIGQVALLQRADPVPWFTDVLGPTSAPLSEPLSVARLRAATHAADFVCPGHQAIPLAPQLIALRNRGAMPWRLLFIAHAAAVYSREWLMLQGQLVAGDVIVAPSGSARDAVLAIAPDLAPFVHMIPHPVRGPDQLSGVTRTDVVTIGRIHADKLTHRLIDAYAMLATQLDTLPPLAIYGSLDDGAGTTPSAYVRSLQARIRRLGLEKCITLAGPVRGEEKLRALARARVVANLSVTLEESCPKAPLEAQAHGASVIGTSWNGLRDNVGPTGRLVPVRWIGGDPECPDVDAEAVAAALRAVLATPTPVAANRDFAAQFSPDVILPRYRAMLMSAREASVGPVVFPPALCDGPPRIAAPRSGLLADVVVLQRITTHQLSAWFSDLSLILRRSWSGAVGTERSDAELFFASVMRGLNGPLMRAAAAGAYPACVVRNVAEGVSATATTIRDLAQAALARDTSVHSRVGAAFDLIRMNAVSDVARALPKPRRAAERGPTSYLEAEVLDRTGSASDALEASRRAALRSPWTHADGARARQLARLARHAGAPLSAVPWLSAWLDAYPDELDSGAVWLDLALCLIRGGAHDAETLDGALLAAERLLGRVPAMAKVRAEREWRGMVLTNV